MTQEEKLALLKSGGKLLTNGQEPTLMAPTGEEIRPITSQSAKELTGASSTNGIDLVKEAMTKATSLQPAVIPPPEAPEQPQKKVEPTVDKSLTLINTNGQELNFGDPEINKDAIKNAIASGFSVSKGTPPSWLQIKTDGTSAIKEKTPAETKLETNKTNYENALNAVNNFDVSKDPNLQSILSGITNTWNARIKQMEASAKSSTGAARSMFYRLGGQYTGGAGGTLEGIVTATEQAGLDKITEYESQKRNALTEATVAYKKQAWSEYVDKVNIAEKAYDKSIAAVNELNKTTKEEEIKRKEAETKRTNQSTITSLMSEGVTDPLKIFNAMTAKGYPVNFKDITEITTEMRAAESSTPGIVGEWMAAKENDPEFANMSLKDYSEWKNPGSALDYEKKLLDIAKVKKELESNGITDDPISILAYAQQYASTGTIPTGVKSDTFGIIAQTAKEFPKVDGEIIDNKTGIRPSKLTAEKIDGLAAMRDLTLKLDEAKILYNDIYTGLIAGTVKTIVNTKNQQKYDAVVSEITDLLARARSGAALSKYDEQTYASKLPSRWSDIPIIGQKGDVAIDSLKKSIGDKLDTSLKANGASMVGVTKIKIDGQEYTVGQTITNKKGQVGRVLAEGKISFE